MAVFYYPIALMAMSGLSMILYGVADLSPSYLVKIPLLTIGGILQVVALIASVYMLYVLGQSIIKDEKKEAKKDEQ
jgi:hypothetical protein